MAELYLIIELAGERYGLPAASLREVMRRPPITPVPGAPPTIGGLIARRGEVLPVFELRALFGSPRSPEGERAARLVITAIDDDLCAFSVDAALDLIHVDLQALEPPPTNTLPVRGLLRSEQGPLLILDPAALLAALELAP